MTTNARILPKRRIIDPESVSAAVFVLADRHDKISAPWHHHRRLQFLHVSEGVLTVETASSRFVIPPQRGVWVPPGVEHRIRSAQPFWLTTCYIDLARVEFPPVEASAVSVDRLTDALLIAVGAFGMGGYKEAAQRRKAMVLLDCLAELPRFDVVLPLPTSERLRRLTNRLMVNPARNETLATLAAEAALTERTAARLFKTETGLSFGVWRLQLRLQTALGLLSEGRSVTETAFDVGYQDASSFIAAFRDNLGQTPTQVLAKQK